MILPPAFIDIPIAHRGLHDAGAGRPENSASAIQAAVDAGYGIEIDLQISADGVAMVFHDYDLDRLTTESGPLKNHDAAALVEKTLRGSDGTIPTLHAVLQIVSGRVPLLIEIKDQSRWMGPVDSVLEKAVAEELSHYAGPVAVMSFNPHSVAALGQASPETPRGIVSGSYDHVSWEPLGQARLDHLRAIADFDDVGASFVSHDRNDLSDPAVKALRARGVPVLSWTITSRSQADEALTQSDNITFEGFRP